jgi:hypothetical protein
MNSQMPGHSMLSLFRPGDLEHIPERRYRQLIDRALLKRGDAAWLIPLVVGALASAVWLAVGYGFAVAMSGTAAPNWARIGFVNVTIAGMVTLVVGSIVRWKMVTSSIRRLMNRAACPYCEFSLVGLQVENGGVVCPECGERLLLHELGLSKDDLLPDTISMLPFDGAGKLGSFSGTLTESTKIRPDKSGNVRKPKPKQTASGGDVVL